MVQKLLAVLVLVKSKKKLKQFAVLEEQTMAVWGMCDAL